MTIASPHVDQDALTAAVQRAGGIQLDPISRHAADEYLYSLGWSKADREEILWEMFRHWSTYNRNGRMELYEVGRLRWHAPAHSYCLRWGGSR